MGMVIGMAEFLEKVCKLKKKEEKIEALKMNDSPVLRTVLQGAFDPSVKWLLPEGIPPYKENDLVDQEHVFLRDYRKIPYFIEGFYPDLKQTKREQIFIEMLETLAPADAKLLASIKDKKFPYKGLTIEIVKEALPGLINEQAKNTQVS
jgi:hypothetical protein